MLGSVVLRRRVAALLAAALLAAGCSSRDDADPSGAHAPPSGANPPASIPVAPKPVRYTVCLQPLGEHDASLLAPVSRAITQAYGFDVRQLAPRSLPDEAWYPPRTRYRAPVLLDHLLYDVMPASAGCHAVLGFTGADVSTTKGEHFDWGVLGLAYQGGRVAVVSSYRLRHGVAHARLVERAVKVSLHELGHVIGVPHRDDGAHCIMNDAVGAVATIDRADGPMCAGERAVAERFLGYPLPVPAALDWPAILGK